VVSRLMVAAVAALVWANGWSDSYVSFWNRELTVGSGSLAIHEDLQHWVNDGLMALFFFVVGLEIKRELVTGELRDREAAALPVLAALGGAILPAAIFVALTAGGAGGEGWGIPMATDIAFAVGVLALLGDRVSSGVKLLVLTIAIVDDVVAILVIALYYSDSVSVMWLLAALAGLVAIVLLRRAGVARVLAHVPVGVFVWVGTYESGIHATIAGVVLALLTPARPIAGRRVLEQLEHRLHPVTSFAVVPVFALANAGVVLNAKTLGDAATSRVAWAIVLGLVVGKLLGIAGASLLGVRLGVGALPEGVLPRQVWGVAALGGIGFTVSLFITQFAYTDATTIDLAKVGIFAGSLISGLFGAALLIRTTPRASRRAAPPSRTVPPADGPRPVRRDRAKGRRLWPGPIGNVRNCVKGRGRRAEHRRPKSPANTPNSGRTAASVASRRSPVRSRLLH
jgi:Na+:H+ antiporter, NhaA family